MDVGSDRVPFDDLAVLVTPRHAPMGIASIFAIGGARSHVNSEWRSFCDRGSTCIFVSINIVGMKIDGVPLFTRQAREISPCLVNKSSCAVGLIGSDHSGNRINNEPQFALCVRQFRLTRTQRVLCKFPVMDVVTSPIT